MDESVQGPDTGQHMAVEVGTELQLELDGVSTRLRSELVGLEPGKYLIVKAPAVSQAGVLNARLHAGNRVIVRYVYAGSAYGFETTILESISTPARLLFLTAPRVVVERNIRSARRINTLLPAVVEVEGDKADGTITDISIAGCHFKVRVDSGGRNARKFENVDQEIGLSVLLPGQSTAILVTGQLRNIKKDRDMIELGIAFTEIGEIARKTILDYIERSV